MGLKGGQGIRICRFGSGCLPRCRVILSFMRLTEKYSLHIASYALLKEAKQVIDGRHGLLSPHYGKPL